MKLYDSIWIIIIDNEIVSQSTLLDF